jgi:hypothetical protein
MKVKPKEILVNLPVVLMFDDNQQIPAFASNINTIINGHVKIKYEELGCLGGQYVGIFYLDRYGEFKQLREEFKTAIEQEELDLYNEKTSHI